LKSTKGIVFLGTPHQGSKLATWGILLSNVVNSLTLGQAVRMDLLRNLETGSATLEEISRQFIQRAVPLQIMSFYEMQTERPLSCLVSIISYVPPYSLDDLLLMLRFLAYKLYLIKVVPESSAILGLSNELVLSLNAGHRSMCRYNSEENQNYILVESAIKELVSPKALSSHGTTSEYNIDDFIS